MIGLPSGGLPLGPQPAGRMILVPSEFIEPMEVSLNDYGSRMRLRVEITDDGAEDVLRQLSGNPSQFSEESDLLRRVAEAERHARACMETVADYEGEIEFLKEELKKAEKEATLSRGGIVRNPSPGGVLTAAGGWSAPSVNVYNPAPIHPDDFIGKLLAMKATRVPPEYLDPFTHGDTK